MLYHLFDWLGASVPGSGLFTYISFRAAMAVFVSHLQLHGLAQPAATTSSALQRTTAMAFMNGSIEDRGCRGSAVVALSTRAAA